VSALAAIALRDPKIRYAAAAQARKWPRVRQRDHILRLPASWLVLEALSGNDLGLAEHLASSTQTAWPFAFALLLRRTAATHVTSAWTNLCSARSWDGPRITVGDRARELGGQQHFPPARQQPRPRIRPIRQAARAPRYEMGPEDLLGNTGGRDDFRGQLVSIYTEALTTRTDGNMHLS
jgi:hypothetical protein